MAGANRIALGSAQFGLDYGVNNRRGMVSAGEVGSILENAWNYGIDTLDTAHAYGQSETRLGELLEQNELPYKIITKLDPALEVEESFRDSLRRLRKQKVHGYLIHNYKHYENKPEVWERLRELSTNGRVDRVGFSLYYPRELESLMAASVDFDIVQVPFSIFDRRFAPYFAMLKRMKVEIYVRSVFLQGLVFMNPSEVPSYLADAAEKLRSLRDLVASSGASTAAVCLQFALSRPEINKIVIGVDSLENLLDNLAAASGKVLTPEITQKLDALAIDDERVIVPSKWRK